MELYNRPHIGLPPPVVHGTDAHRVSAARCGIIAAAQARGIEHAVAAPSVGRLSIGERAMSAVGFVQFGKFRIGPLSQEVPHGAEVAFTDVVDLRSASAEQIRDGLDKYYFLMPSQDHPVFFFLKDSCYDRLIPWTAAPSCELTVPYIEAGIRSEISLSDIEEVLQVELV